MPGDEVTSDPNHAEPLTEDQRCLIEEAVRQTLLKLGVDVSTPEAVLDAQRDFKHLRDWRKTVETMNLRLLFVLLSTAAAGFGVAFWHGLKALLTTKGGPH